MIKSELIKKICNKQYHLNIKTIRCCLDIIHDSIIKHLSQGGRVEMRDFGNFNVRTRKSYAGHNPRTGKPMTIAARKTVRFKAGKALKERINATRNKPIVRNRGKEK